MSGYLQTYQRVQAHKVGPKPPLDTNNMHRRDVVDDSAIPDQVNAVQAKFTRLKLTSSSAQSVINSCSDMVQTMDLSHNRIDTFPNWLPLSLVALNLSKNHIHQVSSPKALFQLIELNISRNRIRRILGLAMLVNIQYLDVSNNLISHVEGLEAMKDLKTLRLDCNLISSMTSLRPLSYNRTLTDLEVQENPVCDNGDLRVQMSNLLPNLKFFNGDSIRLRPAHSASDRFNYSELSMCRHATTPNCANSNASSGLAFSDIPRLDTDSASIQTPSPACDGGIEGSQRVRRSALPWRNPPNPLPRPWKGKQPYQATQQDFDRSSSPINYHLRSRQASPQPPPPPPPVEDTASTVYDDDHPEPSMWLCPALNQIHHFDEADSDPPADWESDEDVTAGRRSRSGSPSRPLRSPHTKASLLRAQYTAERLKYLTHPTPAFQPQLAKQRPRRGTPNRSRRNATGADEKPLRNNSTMVVPAEADCEVEEISERDVDITSRAPRRNASPYRLLTQLKDKIDRRFNKPPDNPRGRGFSYLHSLPDMDPALDPFSEAHPAPHFQHQTAQYQLQQLAGVDVEQIVGADSDPIGSDSLQHRRQSIQQQLQHALSPSTRDMLGVGAAEPRFVSAPAPHTQPLPLTLTSPGIATMPDESWVDYDSGSDTLTTASRPRHFSAHNVFSHTAPSLIPASLAELSDLHLVAAGTGLRSDEAKKLSREIEALKSRQLHTLAALQVVSPLQALAAEPVSPSVFTPFMTPAQPEAPSLRPVLFTMTPDAADDQSVGALSRAAPSVSSSVVQSDIDHIYSAMAELRERQQRSLAMLQSL